MYVSLIPSPLPEGILPYKAPNIPLPSFIPLCMLRDDSPRNTPPRRSEWGRSLPPDCFVSRGIISHVSVTENWFSQGGFVSTSPNPQAGGPPIVGCPRLLIQFIRSYPLYRRPFLYPQPEDVPCRDDRDPPTQSWTTTFVNK